MEHLVLKDGRAFLSRRIQASRMWMAVMPCKSRQPEQDFQNKVYLPYMPDYRLHLQVQMQVGAYS